MSQKMEKWRSGLSQTRENYRPRVCEQLFESCAKVNVPPPGKKKFIASDCVYKVLSRNYWAKKTNLRVTHKQVELLSTSTYHLAHEPIHRRDRKNNFTQHSLIYELDCCKHSKNPLRGRGARLPQGYHRRGGGDHYKPRYYNLSL